MIDDWLKRNCVRHSCISGGVVVLLRHLNTWLVEQQQKKCSLEKFTKLLEERGLQVVEVCGTALVLGAGLKRDRDLLEWLKVTHATEERRRVWSSLPEHRQI